MSIAEICYECGFNNLSNFNRIFKKKKACSPKEFRENYRKKKKLVYFKSVGKGRGWVLQQ